MARYSISRVNTWGQCPRKYRYTYRDKVQPIRKATALAVGTVWHDVLEYWWRESPEAATARANEIASELDGKGRAMIAAWLANYAPDRHAYDVLGVEVPFEVPLPGVPGVVLIGRADLVLHERATGRKLIVEHKTTASAIDGHGYYWRTLTIDHQPIAYAHALDADGVVYDVVRKPAIRPSQADAKAAEANGWSKVYAYGVRLANRIASEPEVWHQWREVRLMPHEIEAGLDDLAQHAQAMVRADTHEHYPRTPGSCQSRYGQCPFVEVCTGAAQLDDPSLYQPRTYR